MRERNGGDVCGRWGREQEEGGGGGEGASKDWEDNLRDEVGWDGRKTEENRKERKRNVSGWKCEMKCDGIGWSKRRKMY